MSSVGEDGRPGAYLVSTDRGQRVRIEAGPDEWIEADYLWEVEQ